MVSFWHNPHSTVQLFLVKSRRRHFEVIFTFVVDLEWNLIVVEYEFAWNKKSWIQNCTLKQLLQMRTRIHSPSASTKWQDDVIVNKRSNPPQGYFLWLSFCFQTSRALGFRLLKLLSPSLNLCWSVFTSRCFIAIKGSFAKGMHLQSLVLFFVVDFIPHSFKKPQKTNAKLYSSYLFKI